MIRCDALSDKFNAGSVYCKRRATWSAVWGVQSARMYYCGNHKRYRQRDVSLGDWKKIKD
jgi:hypothetical protein